MNKRIIYIFIFIIFINLNIFRGNIISSTITRKNVNILGVEFNYGIFNVEFDSPLYKYDQLGCPNYNCTIDAIDCSCDYSNVNKCPNLEGRDPSCPACPTKDKFNEDICKTGNNIENVLKVEKDTRYTINASEPIQLRYKANSRICEGLMITSYPIEGFYQLSVGYTQGNQRVIIEEYPEKYSLARMCPSDKDAGFAIPDTWTKDTYFINIKPFEGVIGNVTLSFEITSVEVPPTKSSPSVCTQILSTHQCINEGQVIIDSPLSPLSYNYYTFSVTKSATYTIRVPQLGQPVFILADTINKMPRINDKNFTYWVSIEESENYLTIYLQESSTLYISIYSQFQSQFTFSITSEGYKKKVKVTSLPPKASAYYMVGTSILSIQTTTFQCNQYYQCYPFSNQASYNDSNPLNPVPSVFRAMEGSNIPSFQTISYQDDTKENPINENSYQTSFVFSYQIGKDYPVIIASFDALADSNLVFLNTLYDENDNVLTIYNNTKFEYKEYECNYTDFKEIMDGLKVYENLLFNVTKLNELNNLRYKLDSLTIRDSYIGCSKEALKYANLKSSNESITSRGCHYEASTPEYLSSPCCIKNFEFYECCRPESRVQNVTRFNGVLEDLVSDQCSDPSCTNQILYQYFGSLMVQDECLTPPNTLESSMSNVLEILRDCKSLTKTVVCNSDSDCKSYAGSNGVCDLYYRQCLPDFEYIDKRYLHCVFSQLDQSTVYKVLHKPFQLNSTIIDEIYNTHLKDDITNQVFGNRQLLLYRSHSLELSSYKNLFYPYDSGLDKSMELVHDVKYDGFFNFAIQTTDGSYSEMFGICPFANCYDYANSTYPTQCYQICDLSSVGGFCGYCSSNETFCFVLSYNKNECESNIDYCLLSQQTAYITDPEYCEDSLGYCNSYCGYTCKATAGTPLCINPNIETSSDCNTLMEGQGLWNTATSSCYYSNITTKSDCNKSLNQIWVDCANNIDECTGPLGRLSGMCYISGVYCANEEECLNSGYCSDSYYFNPSNTQGYPQGLGLGKCVKKHQILNTHVRCEFNIEGYTEQDSPMGCFSHYPQVSTRAECESLGSDYKWWSPSLNNKTKCLQEYGCSTYSTDSKMLPYNKIFNEMDQETCTGCSGNSENWSSKFKWENKFEWTKATWIKGVPTKGKWITDSKFTYVNKKTKTLDYQKIYDELVDSVNTQMADKLASEYFCRQQRTKDNLNSVSCSCSGSGGSECFDDTALLLGQIKPCYGSNQIFTFDYGSILFTNGSVREGCGNLLISQYPKNLFTNSEDQHFPSGFVSYPKPPNFGIFNKNRQIIGTLISDGIYLESQNIQQLTVCFNYDDQQVQNHQQYPIYDLASLNLENGILFPLNETTYFSNSSGILQLCADIKVKDPKVNFFPANRVDSWENQELTYFKSDAKGLLYSLGAVFLAVSLYGFYQVVIVFIIRAKGFIHQFELVHLLIFMVFSFVSIRMIYFFILPNGSLAENEVAEYILVILPTFFYFSCFTIIIVLWYTIIYLVLKVNSSRNLKQRVFKILGVVNLIIYILLVIVILVFNFTKNTKSNSCGNRVIYDPKRSNSQKAVSYLYAIFQALISLVIAVAFIYLGSSLWKAINKVKSPNSKTPKHQQKIFLLTTICSAGFVLHCIFIIVCVALNEPNIGFSFAGLILTEIIPSVTILYCYDQRKSLHLDITLSSKSTSSTSSNNNTKLSTGNDDPTTASTFSKNLSSEL